MSKIERADQVRNLNETIIVHDGKFHADDVFSVALWMLWHPDISYNIVRTRDPNFIDLPVAAVLDVGNNYIPSIHHFDHHGPVIHAHPNGIKMATFGMLANYFHMSERFKSRLVYGIDAQDNGQETTFPHLGLWVNSFNPGWDDNESSDDAFAEAVQIALRIIQQELKAEKSINNAESIIEDDLKNRDYPDLLVLSQGLPWKTYVNELCPEVQLVIIPSNDGYILQSVNMAIGSPELKCPIPEWISEFPSCLFRHQSGFMAKFSCLKAARSAAVKILFGQE